jgi:hypothetical protein
MTTPTDESRPTPSERLEARRQLMGCRVCAWLSTLDEKTRKGWAQALANPRYTHTMVAAEIALDGGEVSADSVAGHRSKAHR